MGIRSFAPFPSKPHPLSPSFPHNQEACLEPSREVLTAAHAVAAVPELVELQWTWCQAFV